ncbi:MAG: acyltransferase [Capsulimonas sp.]|uniref:acyltransferase family protein n=1 Tax=Capsulimonas sp. TaxID=2494211 RepID=UPI0032637499
MSVLTTPSKATDDSSVEHAAAPPRHNAALDGLRFAAFLSVFLYHTQYQAPIVKDWVQWGKYGVPLFFVLSGFLIGRILLGLKDSGHGSLGSRLKIFYIRRALRIFPVYYALLVGLALCRVAGMIWYDPPAAIVWHALYLTNLYVYLQHAWIGGASHLWSLSVEEHFYLIAPLAVLILPLRRLAIGFVALWVGLAIARVWCWQTGDEFFQYLSPMQFDYLTVGIAAAIVERDSGFLGVGEERLKRLALASGALCIPVLLMAGAPARAAQAFSAAAGQWLLAVAFAGLVMMLWRGAGGGLQRIFSHRAATHLGKISYGLYLFHNFALMICAMVPALAAYHHAFLPIAAFALTYACAALSWRYLEGPINDLKRRFPY